MIRYGDDDRLGRALELYDQMTTGIAERHHGARASVRRLLASGGGDSPAVRIYAPRRALRTQPVIASLWAIARQAVRVSNRLGFVSQDVIDAVLVDDVADPMANLPEGSPVSVQQLEDPDEELEELEDQDEELEELEDQDKDLELAEKLAEKSVPRVIAELGAQSVAVLIRLASHEADNKNRITVLRAIDKELEARGVS